MDCLDRLAVKGEASSVNSAGESLFCKDVFKMTRRFLVEKRHIFHNTKKTGSLARVLRESK